MIASKQQITTLIYSNIPDIVALWDKDTPYNLGQQARVGNYVYQSTATLNLNKDPTIKENLIAYWTLWGVSNAHAAFDLNSETYTAWEGDGIFTFARGDKEIIGIGRYEAKDVTIDYLDALDNVLDSETIHFNNSPGAYDIWTYMYAPFVSNQTNVIYRTIKKIGVNIRITFENDGDATSCGYCVAGRIIDFGRSLEDINFTDISIGSTLASVANFTTVVDNVLLMDTIDTGKEMRKNKEYAMFVIDPTENSNHKNMVIIGKINKCDGNANNFTKNTIDFQIEQNVEG